MKRFIFATLLTACGGAPAPAPESPTAKADGVVELVAPQFVINIPDNLGHPPTYDDVQVVKGIDGRTPDEVLALVRGKLTNSVDPTNESFVKQTIQTTHKAFTLAVWNAFVKGSPPNQFLTGLGAVSIQILGTVSAVYPTIIEIDQDGQPAKYYVRQNGQYQPFAKQIYPVFMRTPVRLDPMGVRADYPDWSAPVLAKPTTTITEPN